MRRALVIAAVVAATAVLVGARSFRTTAGPQFECMAVPLSHPWYRLDELDALNAQDASDMTLYPTRMPSGWQPVGTTEIRSLAEAVAGGAGRTERRPAVVVCREVSASEPAPPTGPPPEHRPVEKPSVDPTFFEEKDE